MDDSMPMSMPMTMDLTLKCTCHVGKLFISAWDIQTCGTYYASLAFIALFCFLRHLLTMHKTKLILRLAEQDAGTQQCMALNHCPIPPLVSLPLPPLQRSSHPAPHPQT